MSDHQCCESCLQDWEAGYADDLDGACCCVAAAFPEVAK